jgi:hypothetical protein
MQICADKADYTHWHRQVPLKQIVQRQDFFNQPEAVLIVPGINI